VRSVSKTLARELDRSNFLFIPFQGGAGPKDAGGEAGLEECKLDGSNFPFIPFQGGASPKDAGGEAGGGRVRSLRVEQVFTDGL